MAKRISPQILEVIQKVKKSGSGAVTFHFHGGRRQVQQINMDIFKQPSGEDTPLPKIVHLFNDIQFDLGAKYYRIN